MPIDSYSPMATASVLVLKVMRGSRGPGEGLTTNREEGAALQSTVGGYWAPDGGAVQGCINWGPKRARVGRKQVRNCVSLLNCQQLFLGLQTDHGPLLLSFLYCSIHQGPVFIAVQGQTLHPCHTESETSLDTLQHALLNAQHPVDLGGVGEVEGAGIDGGGLTG